MVLGFGPIGMSCAVNWWGRKAGLSTPMMYEHFHVVVCVRARLLACAHITW